MLIEEAAVWLVSINEFAGVFDACEVLGRAVWSRATIRIDLAAVFPCAVDEGTGVANAVETLGGAE